MITMDQFNVSKAPGSFRQTSVEGAQQRMYLSNNRVLSLSYIFLFSSHDNCVLKKLSFLYQSKIIKSLRVHLLLNLQLLAPISPFFSY
ncbi:hypothetical protein EDC94DRAFT_625569 [Helicostylum pulchrum]|nr:hypothetical protein EDC94DRAFT_625569 [Helicostylum pulchrum]